MMSLKMPFVAVTLLAFVACGNVCAETPQPSKDKADKPLAVAIFSRNKTRDAGYEKYEYAAAYGDEALYGDEPAGAEEDDGKNDDAEKHRQAQG